MTLGAWGCLFVIALAVAWIIREVLLARRGHRPVRIGVVFSAAVILAGAAVVGLLTGLDPAGIAGLPRRYATYEPAPAFDYRILVPAAGIGVLLGAFIGAVRAADGTLHNDLPAARTRNRLLAALGTVIVIVGIALLLIR